MGLLGVGLEIAAILDGFLGGHLFGNDDIMIVLFHAYAGSTNNEFKNAVMYWKNEWNIGSLTSAEELMVKADGKYDELRVEEG